MSGHLPPGCTPEVREHEDNRLNEPQRFCSKREPVPADPEAMETLRRTLLRTCTDGELHDWESGGAFGVIVGLSRCRKCQTLSRAEHFEKAETTCDPLSLEPIKTAVRIPKKP